MKKLLSSLFIALVFVSGGFAQVAAQPDNRIAIWKPHFETDNELFPSVVLAMSGREFNARPDSHMLGDPIGMAGVSIKSSVPNAHAHVVIQIDGFSAPSEIDVTLSDSGQLYNVMPSLRYDFQRLVALDQSVPANVDYSVSVNGTDLGHQTLPIRVRSVNDVPFLAQGPDGKPQDLTVLFAAFVNESHPFVDKVHIKSPCLFFIWVWAPPLLACETFPWICCCIEKVS